jgi:hypothetical protein
MKHEDTRYTPVWLRSRNYKLAKPIRPVSPNAGNANTAAHDGTSKRARKSGDSVAGVDIGTG